ncbi:uncharacterized protein LOC134825278 [Bolinopsis microptera]|uniref:uncharacterized protein LOC134825278 n=1 Tax=Bolinopsis microptera TaxID=2820187 RepID=UPI00307A09B3
MVSDKFYLFGIGKNNSNKLPGKSEWKIFNDTNSSSSNSTSSNRPPHDDWANTLKCKHASYSSIGSSASSCSSIKIPSNNEYYVLHKRAYKQEVQANKENKTRFPTTTGLDTGFDFRNNNRDTNTRARSKTTSSAHASNTSSTSSTLKTGFQTSYVPYNSSDKRTPLDKFKANQGDVLMDWVAKMDP